MNGTTVFDKGRDGVPVPWQPCCDRGRASIYLIYPAARLVIWWKRRHVASGLRVSTLQGTTRPAMRHPWWVARHLASSRAATDVRSRMYGGEVR